MRGLLHLTRFFGGLFTTAAALAGTPPPGNVLPDLIDRVSPGVVNISSSRVIKRYVLRGMPEFFGMFGIPEEQMQKQSSLGSGFLIDGNGYILTNNHVVESASEIIITLLDKRRIPAKLIGRDQLYDLALLQLRNGPTNADLKPTVFGESGQVRVGESVFAIGNPFGLQHTVTAGIISAKNRVVGIGPFDDFLQTDCSINFGNSGGPLFNLKGEVIGINTAINAQGQGLGFAIPIDEVKANLAALKNFGYIARAWLGILGETVTPPLQYYYQLPTDHGVVVAKLVEDGPAARAGIKAGDVLLAINDTDVKERGDIQRALARKKADETVKLRVNRQGRGMTLGIKLATAPDSSRLPEGVL